MDLKYGPCCKPSQQFFLLLMHCGKTTKSLFLETDSGGVNAAWSRSAYCSEAHWVNDPNGRGTCTDAFAEHGHWGWCWYGNSCNAGVIYLHSKVWCTESSPEGKRPTVFRLSQLGDLIVITMQKTHFRLALQYLVKWRQRKHILLQSRTAIAN